MARAIRNVFLVLVLVSIVFFGLRAIYRAMASPETKIRWCVETMVEGFNARRMQPVLDGIAKDFVDRSSELKRDDLHSILAWTFLNELDAKGEFMWNAVFDPKEMTIEVAPDKESAAVSCHVQFFQRRGAESVLGWDARVAGTFKLGEDGWQWSVVDSENAAQLRRR